MGPIRKRALRIAAGLALLVVVWQGAVNVERLVREVVTRSARERSRALTAPLAARMRVGFGADYDASLALTAHVPPDAPVLVAYPRVDKGPGLFRRLQHLRTLVCPYSIRGVPFDERHPEVDDPPPGTRQYVLDLESGRDYSRLSRCETLAEGKGYRLLAVGEAAE